MNEPADSTTGHCLCGAVQITVERPSRHVELCHCDMCRRWGGGFYASFSGEAAAIEGEDRITVYRSSEWAERAFCNACGSSLWYRFLPTGNRSFAAGLFSQADGYEIEKEIFVDEKAQWCDGSGDHPRLTGQEIIEQAKSAGFTFD